MISHIFFLFAGYITFLSLIFFQIGTGGVSPLMLVWLGVTIMPVFFALYQYIQNEQVYVRVKPDFFRLVLLMASLCLLIFLGSGDILLSLLFGFFLAVLILGTDERILFVSALSLLFGVIGSLLFDERAVAENLSISVYYALILGVLASLIGPLISRTLERLLPQRPFPSWWDAYIRELFILLTLMRQILPVIILVLFAWSLSPWGYLVSFDIQFIGALLIMFFFASFSPSPDDPSVGKWGSIVMIFLTLCIVWWMFPVSVWEKSGILCLWVGVLGLYHYRGKYVKHLVKKLISL